jgi:hypothetical protein
VDNAPPRCKWKVKGAHLTFSGTRNLFRSGWAIWRSGGINSAFRSSITPVIRNNVSCAQVKARQFSSCREFGALSLERSRWALDHHPFDRARTEPDQSASTALLPENLSRLVFMAVALPLSSSPPRRQSPPRSARATGVPRCPRWRRACHLPDPGTVGPQPAHPPLGWPQSPEVVKRSKSLLDRRTSRRLSSVRRGGDDKRPECI